jgi:hypothetical protein
MEKKKRPLSYQEATQAVNDVKQKMGSALLHQDDADSTEYFRLVNDLIDKLLESQKAKSREKLINSNFEMFCIVVSLVFALVGIYVGVQTIIDVLDHGLGNHEIQGIVIVMPAFFQAMMYFWYVRAKAGEYNYLNSELEVEVENTIAILNDYILDLQQGASIDELAEEPLSSLNQKYGKK